MERKSLISLEERIAKARVVSELVNKKYNPTRLKEQMNEIVREEICFFFPGLKSKLLISLLALLDYGEYDMTSAYETTITYQEVVSKIHCLLEDKNQKERGKKALLRLARGITDLNDCCNVDRNQEEAELRRIVRLIFISKETTRLTLEELHRCLDSYQSVEGLIMNQMNLCNIYGFLASARGDDAYLRKGKVIEEKYIQRFTTGKVFGDFSKENAKYIYKENKMLKLLSVLPATDGWELFESDLVMELLYHTIIFPFLDEEVIKRDRLLERKFQRKW